MYKDLNFNKVDTDYPERSERGEFSGEQQNNNGGKPKTKSRQRSVGEIQRDFTESFAKNNHSPERNEKMHGKKYGSGNVDNPQPVTWVHDDPTKLPQYSQ